MIFAQAFGPDEARGELRRLRRELERIELTRRQRREIESALSAAEDELANANPEKRRVAGQLARLKTVLRSAGALDASRGPARPLDRIAAWLDPLLF
jgi:uncharacterized protein (DUF3084 family)